MRHRAWADSISLNAIAMPAALEAGALCDALAEAHSGESALDRVRGAQVDPVLGRVVVEGEEDAQVVADLRSGLGPLGPVFGGERPRRCFCVGFVFALVNLGQRLLRARVGRLRLLDELVRDGARQMLAAALQAEVAAHIDAHIDAHAGAVPVRAPRVSNLDFRSFSGRCAPSPHPAEGHPQVLIIALDKLWKGEYVAWRAKSFSTRRTGCDRRSLWDFDYKPSRIDHMEGVWESAKACM